jgi:hypothetical protein
MLKDTVLLVLHRLYNNNNRNLWKDLNNIKVIPGISLEIDHLLLIAYFRVNAKQKLCKEGNIEIFKLNDNDNKGKFTSIKQKETVYS